MQHSYRLSLVIFVALLGSALWWSGAKPLLAAPISQATSDPVFVGAGDIADCPPNSSTPNSSATADLLDGIAGTVFALGDNVYNSGSSSEYDDCYEPTWGRHIARTKPVPGNHEYLTAGAAGYYDYFGAAASPQESDCTSNCKGYYSYNLGAWHIVALNSELTGTVASEQLAWLRDDLAAHPNTCTLAYWHRPLFTSGIHQTDSNIGTLKPYWQTLYHYGADVILNGHDHNYERFAPQNPNGQADPTRGIRQFVAGMGGAPLRALATIQPNSEARNSDSHGVLKLTLHPTSYTWQFVPIAGQSFTDTGTANCVTADPTLPDPIGYWRMQVFFEGLTLNSATEDVDASNAGNGGVTFENSTPDNNIGWNELESFNRNQQSAKFGAANSYLEVESNAVYSLSNEVTLAAWVNLANPSPDQKIVGKLWLNFPSGSGYLLGVTDGQIQAEVYDANQQVFLAKGGTIPAATWTHLAMSWKTGGQLIGYINGVAVVTTTASALPIGNICQAGNGGCNVIIGGAPWFPSELRPSGNIDEVLIFDEALTAEAITQLAQRTFIVASSSNVISGCAGDNCTLKTAIEGANAGPNGALRDRIHFALPAPATIQPDAALPPVTDAVVIDGLTQPGASCSTWPLTIKVALDGSNAASAHGLVIESDQVVVRGLNIRNFSGDGIVVSSANDSWIECNLIGTNLAGDTIAPNDHGVYIEQFTSVAQRNRIVRNLIAGNRQIGILLQSTSETMVAGNYIGTNISGTAVLPNGGTGIALNDSTQSMIGGATAQERNLIAGHTVAGVSMRLADGNTVQGNYIGTDVSGVQALGNQGSGVIVLNDSKNNTIGGKNAGNLIAYHLNQGVWISGTTSVGNFIAENRIHHNGGLGIDLGVAGVAANDPSDDDGDANNLQNFPVLNGAASNGSTTTISGTLNSKVNTEYLIEFYSNATNDACQGEIFLGFAFVTTDGSGNIAFSTTLTKSVPAGMKITATASSMTTFDTSEFSVCVPVSVTKPVVSLSPFQLFVNEGAGNATVTVSIAPTVNVPITVLFSTIVPNLPAAEVATPGSDYTAATNQSVVIPAGQLTATIQIPILNDSAVEQNERFGVALDLPANSIAMFDFDNISSFNSVVTISDNDGVTNTAPVVSLRPALLTVNENVGNASLTVALSPTVNVPITVLFSTSVPNLPPAQVATAGSDYLSASNQSLVIPAGQSTATLLIPIVDDTAVEQNERFNLTLALPANSIATFASANFNALITINDNDTPGSNTPPVATAQTVNLLAGTALSFTLAATDSENDALTFRIVSPPTNGALTGTPPALTYTPNPGFTGADSFSFVANDGQVDSSSVTVILQVAVPPDSGEKEVYLPLIRR